jgi:surface protein
VKLPLISTGTYNFVVNWGDGNSDTINTWNQAQTTHTYASSGDYTITITGVCTGFAFSNTGDRLKILNISSFGDLKLISILVTSFGVFYGCNNLDITATDIPDISSMTNLNRFFEGCANLVYNSSINNWNISHINGLNSTFRLCSNFNQPLNNWNTSNVTAMGGTFSNMSFNQNISNWDTSEVTTFTFINIGMFQSNPAFNQPLNDWDLSSCIEIRNMFLNATSFNQDLNSWDVSNVTSPISCFQGATNFNGNISSWNTGNFISIDLMFRSSSFNKDISTWNTSNVTNMGGTFSSCPFNQNIGGWDTSKVTTFTASNFGMFQSNTAFNQNIGSWDLSSCIEIRNMFSGSTAFNQNLGLWNVVKVANANGFMAGKTAANYSAANLDSIYNGWSLLTFVNTGITISFGTIKYTASGQAGRDILTDPPNNWNITDGGI